MKRPIAMLLALLLTVSCLSPALAAGEAEAEQSLYEQFGPWCDWTQTQTDAASSWSDEEWEEYWGEYQWAVSLLYDQYWSDYDTWYYEYRADEDEDEWADYLRQEKIEMGMPYPDGINLALNGAYMDLGTTPPRAVSGRTMVPVRAFLEGMGAAVNYDRGKITAVLENGDSLILHLDSTQLETVRGDKIEYIEMDVAPFAQAGRTYIPARFAAEALGLDVYWDDTYEVVHLTDWAALEAELDGQFTSLNAILAAGQAAVDRTKTYATTEKLTLSGTLYGEKQHDTASIALDVQGLQNSGGLSADVKLRVDLGDLEETIFSALPQEALEYVDLLNDSRYSLIFHAESGTFYAKGDTLGQVLGTQLPDGAWVGQTLDAGTAQVLRQALSGALELPTVGRMIVQTTRNGYYYYRQSPWEVAMDSAKPLLLVCSDENFTKTGSGDNATYTAKLDMAALAKRAAELGLLDDLTIGDLLTGERKLPTVDLTMTARVSAGKLTSISCKGSVKIPGSFPVEITMDVSGTPLSMKGSFAFKGAYVGKIEMSMGSTASVTTRTVPTAPPDGATVLDYEVAMGWREPGVSAQFGAARYVQCAMDAYFKGACEPDYLKALGITEAELQTRRQAFLEEQAEWLGYSLEIYEMDDALRQELAGLLQEAYAKTSYLVGQGEEESGGFLVDVEIVPTDALLYVVEQLDARVEELNAAYPDEMTDAEWAAYEAEWNQLIVSLFREGLAQAQPVEPENSQVFVARNADGTLSLDSDQLSWLSMSMLANYY